MIGSPVKNLVQMGKDVVLDFVSADAREKFDKAARDVIGAALFSTDIKTYSFYNDAENLQKASDLYQRGMAFVNEYGLNVLTPAEHQQLQQLGEFVNSKAPGTLNEAYQGGAGAVDLTTTILLGVVAASAGLASGKKDGNQQSGEDSNLSLLDSKAETHILDGDGPTSGGHRYGTGKPGKSEFPQGWDDQKIKNVTSEIATDPSLNWSKPDPRGYIEATKIVDGIEVKVVVDTKKGRVVTAYPTNTPKNPKK
jgi:hypothetical protein